ncbi:hypothetical protein CHARACLAT_030886 [Characodon lateralis]|uniref:Uncharacterized protein n=1 Tax=Characodon lateralis TaxID=208331 RepID=A0ABU7CT83_9TELE|nr:hypothetical protein [Characodon lateralis]
MSKKRKQSSMFAEDTLFTESAKHKTKTTQGYRNLLNMQVLKGCSESPLTQRTLCFDLFLSLLSETTDHGSSKCDNGSSGVAATQEEKVKAKDKTYWKEMNAAMALTNLAQGKDSVSGTTSCIIQKSSHIAEVKTVKKAAAAEVLALTLSSHPDVKTSKHSTLSKLDKVQLNSSLNEGNFYLRRGNGLFKAEEKIIWSY